MKRTYIFIACLIGLMTISTDASENYPQIEIVTTSGTIVVELDRNRAPKTVENFLNYVESGLILEQFFIESYPALSFKQEGMMSILMRLKHYLRSSMNLEMV